MLLQWRFKTSVHEIVRSIRIHCSVVEIPNIQLNVRTPRAWWPSSSKAPEKLHFRSYGCVRRDAINVACGEGVDCVRAAAVYQLTDSRAEGEVVGVVADVQTKVPISRWSGFPA